VFSELPGHARQSSTDDDDVAQPASTMEFRRQLYRFGNGFEHDRKLGQHVHGHQATVLNRQAAVVWTIALKVQTAFKQPMTVRADRIQIQVLSSLVFDVSCVKMGEYLSRTAKARVTIRRPL
jgi:hypothetical protein